MKLYANMSNTPCQHEVLPVVVLYITGKDAFLSFREKTPTNIQFYISLLDTIIHANVQCMCIHVYGNSIDYVIHQCLNFKTNTSFIQLISK